MPGTVAFDVGLCYNKRQLILMRVDGALDKYQTLSHYFGYKSFRSGQEELIDGILAGSDVLGIMPTGAGKSICYQIPALMMDGITLVISPLISLMKDQVGALVQSGVSAAFINSTLTPRQSELALYRAGNGIYKIIYVAPERLTAPSFLDFARYANIRMVVVDEAHCVSQWGQNFRPSYLQIASFVSSLSKRPVVAAFTATATDKVKRDIVNLLGLKSPGVTATGFDRPNLYFEVIKPKDKFTALTGYLSANRGKSGIIYCATRKLVEEVSDRLTEEGWNVGKYHAGMSDGERNAVQDRFIRDECPIIVATNAFGMGIDKSNVAFVVHYNMPKNMESYYQEAGRAGRDGEPAECILLYSGQDVRINTFLIEKSFEDNDSFDEETAETLKANELALLRQMTFYATGRFCYRKAMLRYFGEHPDFDNCGNCSNCTQSHVDLEARDITVEAQKILSCIYRMRESQTKWVIIDILRGTDNNRVAMCGGNQQSTFGIMKENSSREIEAMIDAMIGERYIREAPDGILSWGTAARGVIASGTRVVMRQKASGDGGKPGTDEKKIGENANPELLNRLKALRKKVAELNGVPAFVIFSDATLRDMAEKMPSNAAHFQKVYGVGRVKTEKFGRVFIEEIEAFLRESGTELPVPSETVSKSKRSQRVRSEPAPEKPRVHLEKDPEGRYILPPEADGDLFAALRTLRADMSSDFGITANSLASTDALAQISMDLPVTLRDLEKMGILPPRTVAFCGGEIVRAVRKNLCDKGNAPAVESDCPICPDEALWEILQKLRKEISQKIYTPVNRIFSDAALRGMSEVKPVSRSQLVDRLHLSDVKCLLFGRQFVGAVRGYVSETESPDGFEGMPEMDWNLFVALAELRHTLALREDKFELSVMSDQTLYDICVRLPRNEEDFQSVYGIGPQKVRWYAGDVIGCVERYLRSKGE